MAIDIDLWLWSLTPSAHRLSTLSAHLDASEQARAARFVSAEHANAYRAGRGRLREILSDYTGTAPADLVFSAEGNGKPVLPDGPHFNLSHAGDVAALAVTQVGPLGIDIEPHREVEEAVAERFFAKEERRALRHLKGAEWVAGFFRCWTRKEAVIKAVGEGLSMPLDSFTVTLAPDAPARLLHVEPCHGAASDWQLLHLVLGPRFPGAIAMRTGGARLRLTVRDGVELLG